MKSPDYRDILRRNFEHRARNNPNYSLRAFSRDLRIAPSQMSGILKGKLGLSRHSALIAGKSMGMTKNEVDVFVDLVESLHGRSRSAKHSAQKRIRSTLKAGHFLPLPLDQFHFISDWFHLAILEISYLKDFSPKVFWIAEKLGISPYSVSSALDRLQRLGLIQFKGSTWKTTQDWSRVSGNAPSLAIQAFHRQLLGKAAASLESQSIDLRDIQSTIMAIRKDKIEEAKIFLKKFHEDFCLQIGDDEKKKFEKEAVYCMTTAFFALSNTNSSYKVDQGGIDQGGIDQGAEAQSLCAAQADRLSNDGLRGKWNWYNNL